MQYLPSVVVAVQLSGLVIAAHHNQNKVLYSNDFGLTIDTYQRTSLCVPSQIIGSIVKQ